MGSQQLPPISSHSSSQNVNISGGILKEVQIGGIAGHDLTQIQGDVHVTNVYSAVGVKHMPTTLKRSITQQEYRRRQVLINKVRRFWIDGLLNKSLHTKVLIELGLEEYKGLVNNPLEGLEEFSPEDERTFPEGKSAASIFEDMGNGRTLLVLGEPGAGKTVTLLKIAESVISQVQDNINQPLPVIFNLSSWSEARKPITEWLAEELNKIYKVSKSLSKLWIAQEQLVLFLDGLDEVRFEYRNDCVRALNQFIQEHGLTEIVICSRIRDYESLSERLDLYSAIYIEPLKWSQVEHFIDCVGGTLDSLKEVLKNNVELRSLAASPLLLSIMSLAYKDYSTEAIKSFASSDEHIARLFDTYIDRMLNRRGSTRRYSKEQTIYWLFWLAQQLDKRSQTLFLIERLQPSWLQSSQEVATYRIITGLSFGFLVLLLSGSPSVLAITLEDGIVRGIIHVFEYGVIAIFAGFIVSFLFKEIRPVETLKWSWEPIRKVLWIALKTAFVVAPLIGLISGILIAFLLILIMGILILSEEKVNGGVVDGIVGGLLLAVATWISTQLLQWWCCRLGHYLNHITSVKRLRGIIGRIRHLTARNLTVVLVLTTFLCGFSLSLFEGISYGLTEGLLLGAFLSLIAFPVVGLLGGLVLGSLLSLLGLSYIPLIAFRGPRILKKSSPNEGIRKSAKNAVTASLWAMSLYGIVVLLGGDAFNRSLLDSAEAIRDIVNTGLWAALICGGAASFRHLTLRIALYRENKTPWNYARFLDSASDQLLVQKVGGSYIFVHRMLLEHFSRMSLDKSSVSSQRKSYRSLFINLLKAMCSRA